MRVIIAGTRTIKDHRIVEQAINEAGFAITMIVSGGARGVDRIGEMWASRQGLQCRVFEALWNKYGKGAGFKRNEHMARFSDALIAVWDGKSKGTADMIERAKKHGLKVYVKLVGEGERVPPIRYNMDTLEGL